MSSPSTPHADGNTVSNVAGDIVQFIGVGKSYDAKTRVVDNLHLNVRKGEFLTLLGPSGSGKTTCLMMLAGFENWTAGDIQLEGKSLQGIPSYKRDMGVVFQSYALFPHMTVGANVAFPLKQRAIGKSDIEERVRRALAKVELESLANRYPAQLSGGQQQRVALARALVFDPKLVLMDEPLGALDRRLREQMQIEIKHLHQTVDMTVIYVTHDQGEALTMSDRVAVFNKGRIEQIGSPHDIYERPETAFVANFIGENNNIAAEVLSSSADRCRLRLNDGTVIEATQIHPLRVGEKAILSLRPELIKLTDSRRDSNRVAVSLREQIYCGDHILLRCELATGDMLIAKTSLAEGRQIANSTQLSLSWSIADGRALR
jgi:putative spermidine/putrescine transport system ATP-binding protein